MGKMQICMFSRHSLFIWAGSNKFFGFGPAARASFALILRFTDSHFRIRASRLHQLHTVFCATPCDVSRCIIAMAHASFER